jgi:hypothetical protein
MVSRLEPEADATDSTEMPEPTLTRSNSTAGSSSTSPMPKASRLRATMAIAMIFGTYRAVS